MAICKQKWPHKYEAIDLTVYESIGTANGFMLPG